jgi:hypothetical protein
MPIEKAMAAVPGHWLTIVTCITNAALKKALDGGIVFPEASAKKAGQ